MEREEEKAVSELEKDIAIWKESQAMHADDTDYFMIPRGRSTGWKQNWTE